MPGNTSRGSTWLGITCVWLIGAGLAVIGLNAELHKWAPPPVPPASAAAARGHETLTSAQRGTTSAPMGRSLPVTVAIPAIQVRARIIPLGLDPSGSVAVPSLNTPFLTSWYDRGSAPGQAGPAVLFGHVDSAKVGPAVFYRLGDLRPGDLVYVTRRDGRTAIFRVSAVAMYSERNFPSGEVYGFSPHPTLRLVTCGGAYDDGTHLYLDRIIAFAVYEGQEPARA
jgi:Sortase domain